jgi:hypothetical protein
LHALQTSRRRRGKLSADRDAPHRQQTREWVTRLPPVYLHMHQIYELQSSFRRRYLTGDSHSTPGVQSLVDILRILSALVDATDRTERFSARKCAVGFAFEKVMVALAIAGHCA